MSTKTSESKVQTCPPKETLRQLVSGSLNEDRADALFQHLDECQSCQHEMDVLAGDAPVLLGDTPVMLGDQIPEGVTREAELSQLIKQARKLGSPRTETPAEVREPVAIEGFIAGMKRCGLFTAEEVDSLLAGLEASSSVELAQELQQRGHLTRFQAKVLLSGRKRRLVLGNYDILKKLGQGGMGSVFKARHRRLGRVVCVKVMNSAGRRSPDMLERFQNEARTVASLSHPNFVVAHDANEADGIPFLVMEYIEGNDLARHVSIAGPLPVDFALKIVHQAAAALQYAHDQGITHRDIKPHNIVVTREDDTSDLHVTILDLGLARIDTLLEESPDSSSAAAMTRTGVIMGTVDYMSPEQAIRSRDADNRSDIYSLGCTLHFLLTGLPVYTGDTLMARLVEHRESLIPSLEERVPGTPSGLDAIFHQMLAKKPEDRYQSMQDLVTDLDALMIGQKLVFAVRMEKEATSVLEERRRTRRPPYSLWLAVCSSILMFAAAVIFALSSGVAEENKNTTTDAGTKVPVGEGASVEQGRRDDWKFSGSGTRQITNNILDHSQQPRLEAVVILPTKFDEQDYNALLAAAEKQHVGITIASQDADTAEPVGQGGQSVHPAISIAEIKPAEYDLLIVVGGRMTPLSKALKTAWLENIVNTSHGQRTVVCATSETSYELLKRLTPVRHSHELGNDVFNGVLKQGVGGILHVRSAEKIGPMLAKARAKHQASLKPGVMPETLRALGEGRALILVPNKGLPAEQFDQLSLVLTSHHVDYEVWTSHFGEIKASNGRTLSATRALKELEHLRNWRFTDRYDYLFVFPDPQQTLVSDTSENLHDLLQTAANDGAVIAGVTPKSWDVIQVGIAQDSIQMGEQPLYHYSQGDQNIVVTRNGKSEAIEALYHKAVARRGHTLKLERDAK